MDTLQEKLLGFLAAGVPQTAAALAAGCTDGYISQLMQEPHFRKLLAERGAAKLEVALKHDTSIEAIESRALTAIGDKLPFVRSPVEAAKIFQILNSAKKRLHEQPGGGSNEALQHVTIVLPRAAQIHLQMNSLRQVIEVEGRSMATLPSRALPSLAAERDAARATELLDQMEVHETVIGGVVRVL